MAIDNFGFEYSKTGKAFVQSRVKARIAATPQKNPPVITSALTAAIAVSAVFTYQITATNNPTSFSASGLPPNIYCNPLTGLISGVSPSSNSTWNLTITATNAYGTGTANVVLTVGTPTTQTINIPSGVSTQKTTCKRRDNPYGTMVLDFGNITGLGSDYSGKGGSVTTFFRYRTLIDFPVTLPGGTSACTSASLTINPQALYTTGGGFTFGWYISNTDDFSAGASVRAYHTNNLVATVSSASLSVGVNCVLAASSVAAINARIGGHCSCVLATTDEVAGSGSGSNDSILWDASTLVVKLTFA